MSNGGAGWGNRRSKFVGGQNTSGRVDLDPEAFEKLIREKGTRVCVFRTTFCPNVKSIDGAEHNIDCQLCKGSGFLDVYPIETVAFIQNQSLEKMPSVEGMVDGNAVLATFPAGIELQYFTLVRLVDFTEPFFQRIMRQEGEVDVLKYKACRVNVLIDSNGKEYHQENDFLLDVNGSIRWKPNRGPNPGDIYTIHYDSQVQFRAVRAMHTNRFTQFFDSKQAGIVHTKLPEQWLLQKEFLVERTDKDGNTLMPNLIHPKTDPNAPEEDY